MIHKSRTLNSNSAHWYQQQQLRDYSLGQNICRLFHSCTISLHQKRNRTRLFRAVSRVNFIPVAWHGCPKKCPQKTKSWIVEINLFLKRKSNETCKGFHINYPYNCKCRKTIFNFNSFFLGKLKNTLPPNSLGKLMQLISMEPHMYDLHRSKKTDLDKFLKKQHSIIVSWCNLTIHI